MLRPYQQEATDAILQWVRKCTEPCLLEAATGAGKSHIIAVVAEELHRLSKGKHILCIAPSAELVTQNREKYLTTGKPASIMSASAGGKCLRHPVVFGTPQTVANSIARFDGRFCAVVIDEAHKITPTVKRIIEELKAHNKSLRVIGLTATPYRLGSGYIFKLWPDGSVVQESQARDPYFLKMVYRIQAGELIDQGFLTRPVIGSIGSEHYETLGLQTNSMGQLSAEDVDRAFHGRGRKTAAIVADVVAKARDRQGVMLFAQTVQHANEIMESLPAHLSEIVTGETPKKERDSILARFKARKIKYLVNVSVLTTGFDAPHVDLIAILRATESVALLQQIIGRGLRIDNGKTDCLVLDYAQNIEKHCPDGDVFNPKIKANFAGSGELVIPATCPECGTENQFSARPNPDRFEIDSYGYFLDAAHQQIPTEFGSMPAHFGRRCGGGRIVAGMFEQCRYRWTSKKCPECDGDNDIAARYCAHCKAEIVDPNEKLRIDFKALKKDPTRIQTDSILSFSHKLTFTRGGKESIVIDIETPYRRFSAWFHPWVPGGRGRTTYLQMIAATNNMTTIPATVTYKKNPDSGFFEVMGWGEKADEIAA